MKEEFWNYSEPIEYQVILVELHLVRNPPLHWQNAFAGEQRQVVEVRCGGQKTFLIDNADGSGFKKIAARGGPDSMSRYVGGFKFIAPVEDGQIQQWNPEKCKEIDAMVEKWQQANYPEEYKKLQAAKSAWENSSLKKMLDKARRK